MRLPTMRGQETVMSPFSCRFVLVSVASLFVLSAMLDEAQATLVAAADADPSGTNLGTDVPPCHRYDGLQPQGTTNPSISTCETMSPEMGRLRARLAEDGWLIQGGSAFGGTFDLAGHEAHPQLYIGQNPTYRANTFMTATYDLSRIGFAGAAQLVFNANVQWFSYAGENPTGFAINSFYVSQRFNDGRMQLQYGFEELGNQFESPRLSWRLFGLSDHAASARLEACCR